MPRIKISPSYDSVAKTLHWLIAAAIVAMLAIGWIMANLPRDNPHRFGLFQLHKSVGITILLLSLFRLGWRLTHPAPPLPGHMPGWEKFAARASHILFYVFMIGMPLLGWGMVSSSAISLPTLLYGIIPWPDLPVLPALANKKEIGHTLATAHYYGAFCLTALLVLHVTAAHKHHWFDGDDVLTRMAPAPIAHLLNRMRGMK